MCPPPERRRLLELAREAIAKGKSFVPPDEKSPILLEKRAVFVSLHKQGMLRGCIGHTVARQPLYLAVVREALRAAFEDPRFDPVQPEELRDIDIEISVLSPFEKIKVDQVRVGEHGLLVERGSSRGLLLPQVAVEHRWDARRFVEETCRKAGMERDAWQNGATLQGFTAEVFSEMRDR